MTDKRKAYEERLDAQLEQWSAQIEQLKARAEKAGAEARIEYSKAIEVLQNKQAEARTKIHELKTSGDEAWDDLKTGAEKVWDEVREAFQSAVSRFK